MYILLIVLVPQLKCVLVVCQGNTFHFNLVYYLGFPTMVVIFYLMKIISLCFLNHLNVIHVEFQVVRFIL